MEEKRTTAEKVFFKNSRGDRLCGILSDLQESPAGLMAVLCHGFATGKDGRTYVLLEEILNKQGISTMRFDFYGHGESEGRLGDITISEAVDDVLHAIAFVADAGYQRIGLVGSSFGGLAAILAASKREDLAFLALKSPVSDYLSRMIALKDDQEVSVWRSRGFIPITDMDGRTQNLNYSFYEEAKKVRGYEAAGRILVPTLIVHGDKDESIPVEQSLKLAHLLPDCCLEIVAGADHRYSRPRDFEQMLQMISNFIFGFR